MERLTHKDGEGWYIEDQSVHFDMRRRGKEINRLAAYEDTGLTPEDVVRLMETQREATEARREERKAELIRMLRKAAGDYQASHMFSVLYDKLKNEPFMLPATPMW